jgi:hypothetical protein
MVQKVFEWSISNNIKKLFSNAKLGKY